MARRRRLEMTFKPTPSQLETIADYCAANMPVAATAAALDIHPDTLRTMK
jgi:sugar diacid utilization regulator